MELRDKLNLAYKCLMMILEINDEDYEFLPYELFDVLDEAEDDELSASLAHALALILTYYTSMSVHESINPHMNFWSLYGYACGNSEGWTMESLTKDIDFLLEIGVIYKDWKIDSFELNEDFLTFLHNKLTELFTVPGREAS